MLGLKFAVYVLLWFCLYFCFFTNQEQTLNLTKFSFVLSQSDLGFLLF